VDGNGTALSMLILSRRKNPGRKPPMGDPILWCSRNGIDELMAVSPSDFTCQYRRVNSTPKRADVTSNQEKPVDNSGEIFFLSNL
jgi:hypothetical protein